MSLIFKHLTHIFFWNEETQKIFLSNSTKEFKFDYLPELCFGFRKEILKFFLEIFNVPSINVLEIKKV